MDYCRFAATETLWKQKCQDQEIPEKLEEKSTFSNRLKQRVKYTCAQGQKGVKNV